MICFLTSYPLTMERNRLNDSNGFVDRLRDCLPNPCNTLFICSDPDGWERTDFFADMTCRLFAESGFCLRPFSVLDHRNACQAGALVKAADLILLTGGHVPTQNRFFAEIRLKELLGDFDGVLIGISAGSMNSAETVYAQPEEEGEAVDPNYRRFLSGLGLTQKMIIPHYRPNKTEMLDGLRVMEDISYPDSMGREFLVFPDGTYLLIENGTETVCGEAWRLADGVLSKLSQ